MAVGLRIEVGLMDLGLVNSGPEVELEMLSLLRTSPTSLNSQLAKNFKLPHYIG